MELEDLRINSQKIIDSYIDKSDWRHSENANQAYSYSGLLFHAAGSIMAHYALRNLYTPRIAKAHYKGDIHIHDLSNPLIPYCCGHDLALILAEGLKHASHVASKPAKHFRSILHQLVNYIGVAQHEFSGAQALSSVDTLLAPFIYYDKLNDTEIKQSLQEYLFNMNTASRWGQQLVFSNLSLDLSCPSDLKNQYITIGGNLQKNKYSDFQDEIERFNTILFDLYYEGDMNGRPFTFPIPNIGIDKNFPWDSKAADSIFRVTAKYGIPYFENFINTGKNPSDVRALCCRLQLDLTELKKKTGGLFGYGASTGSQGVVTINMNRIGYLSKNEDEYFDRLEHLMDIAKQSLEIKRKRITQTLNMGLLPLTKNYIGDYKNFFSTIGIVGMNDSMLNFLDCTIGDNEGQQFSIRVLKFMREKLLEFQNETNNLYSLEATPAESAAYRLAKLDKTFCKDIKFYNVKKGDEEPYLTNSSQLPVDFTEDPFEALRLQEELQSLYNSGTVMHLFNGEAFPAPINVLKKLIKIVSTQFKIPCFTWTPNFSICPNCGFMSGEILICPKCKSKCEVYSRIVGYLRPIDTWNKGKQEEFKERKTFNLK